MRPVLIALLCALSSAVFARVDTQSSTDADTFCSGPADKEICFDKNGNIVPTTDNNQDLGSSALEFKDLYIDGTATVDTLQVDDGITSSGDLSVTGSMTVTSTLTVLGNGFSVGGSSHSIVVSTDGVGLNYLPDPVGLTSPVVTIGGGIRDGTASSTFSHPSALQLVPGTGLLDGDNFQVNEIDWIFPPNNVSDTKKKIAAIEVFSNGSTTNDRGGYLVLNIKEDGGVLQSVFEVAEDLNVIIPQTLQVNGTVTGRNAAYFGAPPTVSSFSSAGNLALPDTGDFSGDLVSVHHVQISSTMGGEVGPEVQLLNPASSGGDRGRISFYGNGALRAYIDFNTNSSNSRGEIFFRAGTPDTPEERMRIDSDGDLGIGTTSPGVKLDVVGGIGLYPRTIAQLVAISTRAGVEFYCSDCSPPKIVVTTGTGAGNFADAVGATFK